MLGYSDAGKDEGFLAAQWTLYEAQEQLARQARAFGVDLRLFHGRGGSPPRGGGPAYRVILAQPPGTVGGRIKITEQGEVVTAKFSHRRLAVRSLEQTVAAVVHATVEPGASAPAAWRAEMANLAGAAREAYHDLVERDETLVALMGDVTPLELLDELKIASRPSSRTGRRALSELRAIPWVFAWMQNRIGLPSWYGAGTALAAGDLRVQRDMQRDWPFFRGLVETLEGAVASVDLAIGERYFALAEDRVAADRLWERLRSEHARATSSLLAITGRGALEPPPPDRVPWLDALSHLQVELLRRHRSGDVLAREPLLATVAGIATGLRTTG
jgi:phosphoenolpyruvate carboxylase